MNTEEYNKAVDQETLESKNRINKLAKSYAFANNTVKIGDMISDNIGSIKVEIIKFGFFRNNPECVYLGTKYTKSGKKAKRQDDRVLWQSNLKDK